MLQKPRVKNIINYTISIVAFVWMTILIVKQIKHQDKLQEALAFLMNSWTLQRKIYLSIVVVLMLLNWSIEAIKWKKLLQHIQQISFGRSLRSVFTGISVSLLTPNRIGEYAGRIIYLTDDNKLKGITANIVSSFAQFIAASVFGIAGCIFHLVCYQSDWYLPYILVGSIAVLIVLCTLYFKLDDVVNWLNKFTIMHKINNTMQIVKSYNRLLLLQLIALSALRYTVFAMQYYFLLQAFGIPIALIPALLSVFLIFWMMAIIPTIALAEIPVRTEISYRILQVFSTNTIGIMSASVLLWLINLMIPAIIGAVVLIGAKFSIKAKDA
jgi:uncharacterized membrane protein YbhN (UPF0104 family)